MKIWLFLAIAIVCEVVATSALKASDGFTKAIPLALMVVGYGISFYFLSLSLKVIPVGVAYAIWAGVGVALIAVIGWLVFGQRLNFATLIGILMIVSGVVVINIFGNH